MEHHSSKYSALLHTLDPWMGSKVKTFLKVMLHIKFYKERSLEHYASKMFDLTHTSGLWDWVKRSRH